MEEKIQRASDFKYECGDREDKEVLSDLKYLGQIRKGEKPKSKSIASLGWQTKEQTIL